MPKSLEELKSELAASLGVEESALTGENWNTFGYKLDHDNTNPDFESAFLCFEEAVRVDQNDLAANFNIGLSYYLGHGVSESDTKAKQYFEKAIVITLDKNYKKDQSECLQLESLEHLIKIKTGIHRSSCLTIDHWVNVAIDYHKTGRVNQDNNKIARLCLQFAALEFDANNPTVNYHLGCFYRDGAGVAQDLEKAKNYYKTSNHRDARNRLLEIEMSNFNPTADDWVNFGVRHHNATGIRQDCETARFCYEAAFAINPGHNLAHFQMGLLYQYGNNVPKNTDTAKEYYQKAHDNGHPEARNKILEIENSEGPGLVKTTLLPQILADRALTESERLLCIKHKDTILSELMTTYVENLLVLQKAQDCYTVLGGILAAHRKPSKLTNFYHHANTNSVAVVRKQYQLLCAKEEEKRKQSLAAAHVPVVGVVASDDVLETSNTQKKNDALPYVNHSAKAATLFTPPVSHSLSPRLFSSKNYQSADINKSATQSDHEVQQLHQQLRQVVVPRGAFPVTITNYDLREDASQPTRVVAASI